MWGMEGLIDTFDSYAVGRGRAEMDMDVDGSLERETII